MKEYFKLNTAFDGMRLNAKWTGDVCVLTLTNCTDREITVGDLTLFEAKMPFSADTEFYGEGFNMLSQYGGTVDNFRLLGSFSDYDHYKLPKPEGINQVYNMAVFCPKGDVPHLIGFASCRRFNG